VSKWLQRRAAEQAAPGSKKKQAVQLLSSSAAGITMADEGYSLPIISPRINIVQKYCELKI
jgi:hypothetical protein